MKDEPWIKCIINNRGDGSLSVCGTYCKSFMTSAGRLGGRWVGEDKHWLFPIGQIAEVRKLCLECYGFTDIILPEFVSVDISADGMKASGKSLYVCGFSIAFVKGGSVVTTKARILNGGFSVKSDGESKSVAVKKDTVVRMSQFPKTLAQLHPEFIKIVERRRFTSTSRLHFNIEHNGAEGDDITAMEIRQALSAQLDSLSDEALIKCTIEEDLYCHADDIRPMASVDLVPADTRYKSASSLPAISGV